MEEKRFEFNYVSDTVSLGSMCWPPVEVTKKLFKIYILQNDIKSIYDDVKTLLRIISINFCESAF